MHHECVGTTLALDDDILRLIKRYAESRSLTLGKAVSDLVRRGFVLQRPRRSLNELQIFDLPPDSPQVTTKRIRELESEVE